jgi:CBS domain-containing protein
LAAEPRWPRRETIEEPAMHRTIVPDIVRDQTLTFAEETTSVREAVRMMVDNDVSAVMICDRTGLRGIFTERDLARKVVAAGLDPDGVTLAAVMTQNPDTLHPGDSPRRAIEKMRSRGYRHLPVVDGTKVVGMVSVRDLYSAALGEMEEDLRELDSFVHGPGYGVSQ